MPELSHHHVKFNRKRTREKCHIRLCDVHNNNFFRNLLPFFYSVTQDSQKSFICLVRTAHSKNRTSNSSLLALFLMCSRLTTMEYGTATKSRHLFFSLSLSLTLSRSLAHRNLRNIRNRFHSIAQQNHNHKFN